MEPRRALALANALTIARVPLAVATVLVLDHPAWAIALVAVAALTDTVDGRLARWARTRGATGHAGAWLDPIADKLFVAIVVLAVVARSGLWVPALLIGAREVVIVPLAAIYRLMPHRRLRFEAGLIGKIATDAQLLAVAVLVALPAYVLPFAIAAGVLGLVAVGDYVVRAVHPVATQHVLDP